MLIVLKSSLIIASLALSDTSTTTRMLAVYVGFDICKGAS